MDKLKTCPFCGSAAKFQHIFENPDKCMVNCRSCDAGIDGVFKDEEEAAAEWNNQIVASENARLTAELATMTAERDRFKARAEAAEADMKRIADDMDGETDACYPCAICAKNNSRCDTSDNCFKWRGPQEGANT